MPANTGPSVLWEEPAHASVRHKVNVSEGPSALGLSVVSVDGCVALAFGSFAPRETVGERLATFYLDQAIVF